MERIVRLEDDARVAEERINMAILNGVVQVAAKAFPETISPKTHAYTDYFAAALFLAASAWFWRRNKRAAIAALIGGSAQLAVSLLTDYPGGVGKAISFETHRDIDLGLGGITAALPEFLGFKNDSERSFFVGQGAAITAVSQLTRTSQGAIKARNKAAA
jgi:hypothetical protein